MKVKRGVVHGLETVVTINGAVYARRVRDLVWEFDPVILDMLNEGSLVLPRGLGALRGMAKAREVIKVKV